MSVTNILSKKLQKYNQPVSVRDVVQINHDVNEVHAGRVLSSWWPKWSPQPITFFEASLYDCNSPAPGALCRVVAVNNYFNKPYFLSEVNRPGKADWYDIFDFTLVSKGKGEPRLACSSQNS